MPNLRPKVRVVQDFAEPTAIALVPDLDVNIVGPCYHIADGPQPNLSISGYGNASAANDESGDPEGLPAEGDDAIEISSPPGNTGGGILDPNSVRIHFTNVLVDVTKGNDGVVVQGENTLASDTIDFEDEGVKKGDRVVLSHSDWEDAPVVVTAVLEVVAGTTSTPHTLVLTNDLSEDMGGNLTSVLFRIERKADDFIIDPEYVTIDGQSVTVSGGVEVNEQRVNSADAYISYRSLRQDLAEMITIERVADIAPVLGMIDERNPLAVGVFLALQNTSTVVRAFGIQSDNLAGYAEALDYLEGREDVYALVPLSNHRSVIEAFRNHATSMSAADISRFRIVLGSGSLPDYRVIGATESTGTTVEADSPINVVHLSDPHPDTPTFAGASVGQEFTLDGMAVGNDGVYIIEKVLSDYAVIATNTDTEANPSKETVANAAFTPPGGLFAIGDTTVTIRGAFDILHDSSSNFVDAMPGDFIAIPTGANFDGGVTLHKISDVISHDRVLIDVMESDTELASSATSTNYRVQRGLTKATQAETIASYAGSLSNSRLTLVWPGQVLLAGVRNEREGVRTWQPGYYIAAALGGQCAGFPPHQNMTGLSAGGIDQVRYSTEYFTESQINTIMEGGWTVYKQPNKQAAVSPIRVLTTDLDFLETMELMVIKNFDFVSIFFRNMLRRFLAGYNVTDAAIGMIRNALDAGIANLQSRVVTKLGAPLIDATIASVDVSDVSADRIDIVMQVTLPRPLNEITLFLTA